jgi:RNA polymerase sigma factor (sigma-70 family)
MDHATHITMAEEQNAKIDQTVREEGRRLLKFIRVRVPDEADAEDIFQDVFSQLIETYRGMERVERVTAWLFRVARNKIADLYRRRKPESLTQRQAGQDDDGPPVVMLQDILPDLAGTPEDALVRVALGAAIEEAVADLPRAQREVFIWHELEDLSFRDMAELTGETENTLRMRKYQAVQFLRRRLDIFYQEL